MGSTDPRDGRPQHSVLSSSGVPRWRRHTRQLYHCTRPGPGPACSDGQNDDRRGGGFHAALSAGRQLSYGGDHHVRATPGGAHGLPQRAPAQSVVRCGRGGQIPTPGRSSVNRAAMPHRSGIALGRRAPATLAGAVRHPGRGKRSAVRAPGYRSISVVYRPERGQAWHDG